MAGREGKKMAKACAEHPELVRPILDGDLGDVVRRREANPALASVPFETGATRRTAAESFFRETGRCLSAGGMKGDHRDNVP